MAKFKSSDFRHKSIFQYKDDVENDYGVFISEWATRVTVGARIVQLSMRDVVAAGIESNVELLRITVPLTSLTHRIEHTDRVSIRGNDYDIYLVDNYDFDSTYLSYIVRRSQGD
jgi:SPP1 family predicted phage head-tail adaptor